MNDPEIRTAQDLSALVERAKKGDQNAYTALYEATAQEVYRTVRAMVRREELTLDIQQDAYVHAFTHLDQLRDPARFLPWIRSIAVNQTRSALRKQTPILFTELENEEWENVPEIVDLDPSGSPELSLERKENARLIREMLDGLSEGQRMLVGMYYYEQIPVERIAGELGVSAGTVKTQLYRARQKIEAAVKELEAQGVKFYGLSPLGFLLALLKKQEPDAKASRELLNGTLSRAGVAAESVAVHVGRSFFQTVLGRVVLGLLAAAVIGGGVVGYRWLRDHANYGDVRPTETVESAEDLTTEPVSTEADATEPVTTEPVDSAEDLSTEPVTTEPVTTEPEISTEASDIPEDPTESSDTQTEPTMPTLSQSSEPQSGMPGSAIPTEIPTPIESQPAEVSVPSSSDTAETELSRPRVVDCYWAFPGKYELFDQPWDSHEYIHVDTENGAVPWLFTDNDNVVTVQALGEYTGGDLREGQTGYMWLATFHGSGTAHVYCVLDGEITHVLTVTNPEYPETILECYKDIDSDIDSDSICLKLDWYERICIVVQGLTEPTVYLDRPDVVRAGELQSFDGGNTNWIHRGYYVYITPLQPGTAHLSVSLNGTVYKTFAVTVLNEYCFPPQTEPTEETTEPAPEPTTEPAPESTAPDS